MWCSKKDDDDAASADDDDDDENIDDGKRLDKRGERSPGSNAKRVFQNEIKDRLKVVN